MGKKEMRVWRGRRARTEKEKTKVSALRGQRLELRQFCASPLSAERQELGGEGASGRAGCAGQPGFLPPALSTL